MSKYDYGYTLFPNTTTAWAFSKIQENSKVLELGPAIGNLAKHLKEEKGCSIDIIEIDEESGKRAAQFARRSLIGIEEGNLEGDLWYTKLSDERYDYIVILDVLEHLKNPKQLLKKVSSLLKEEGKLLVSMPNIAHNSVLINLLNNKFIYTKDGLLDSTHIKFFTYETFCRMIRECDMAAVEKEAMQIEVGQTEIKAVYSDVPAEMELFLRTRPFADVYQFLFTVQKSRPGVEEADFCITALDHTKYKFQVYDEESCIVEEYVSPPVLDIYFKLETRIKNGVLRIDPIEFSSVIVVKGVYGRIGEVWKTLPIINTNGFELGENCFYFSLDDPNIFVRCSEEVEQVHFVCECTEIHLADTIKNHLIAAKETEQEEEYKQLAAVLEQTKEELRETVAVLGQTKEELREAHEHKNLLAVELKKAKEGIEGLGNDLERLTKELEFMNTKWFNRIYNKFFRKK